MASQTVTPALLRRRRPTMRPTVGPARHWDYYAACCPGAGGEAACATGYTARAVMTQLHRGIIQPLSPEVFLHVSTITSRHWFAQAAHLDSAFDHASELHSQSVRERPPPHSGSPQAFEQLLRVLRPVSIVNETGSNGAGAFFERWRSLYATITQHDLSSTRRTPSASLGSSAPDQTCGICAA